jgi:ATP/maltotriose-dependent transcriptional regulator MalT
MEQLGVSYAKFWPPRAPRHGIARAQILDRLRECSAYQLVTVFSPAGYGKTTTLAQHYSEAKKAGVIAVWASLDEADQTPRQFISTILAAFAAYDTTLGRSAHAILQTGGQDELKPTILALLKDVGECQHQVELILDDLHFAENSQTIALIKEILNASPANLAVIISSRFVPNMDVSTLRVRGLLLELGTEDLCFDAEEANKYLNDVVHFPVSISEIEALNRHASGWPLGLQAAAIALTQIGCTHAFFDQYDAKSADLSKFFGTNVFADLEPRLKKFTLEIAQLDIFSVELCDCITGSERGHESIQALERLNLFIEPFDEAKGWFRFHGLFRDFLLQHDEAPDADRLGEIHQNAYKWLLANKLYERAIRHAFDAGLWEEAAELIETTWRTLITLAQFDQLKGWLTRLPPQMLEDRPILQIALAWIESLQRRPDLAAGRIAQLQLKLGLERSSLSPSQFASDPIVRDLLVLQASIDVMKDDAIEVGKLANLENRDFDTLGSFQHGLILNCITFARVMAGQFDGAQRLAQEAQQINGESGHILIGVHGDLFRGFAYQVRGELQEAYDMFLAAHERTLKSFNYPYAAPQYLMAAILFEWNRVEDAQQLIERSKNAIVAPSILDPIIDLYVTRARIAAARGDLSEALTTLGEAELAGKESGSLRLRVAAMAERARLLISQGRLADAQEIERELLQLVAPGRSPADQVWPRCQNLVTQISSAIRIAEGRPEKARDLIHPFLSAAQASGRVAYAIKYLVLDALAFDALGERGAAAKQLSRAFAIGSKGQWTRTFLDYIHGHDALVADSLSRAMAAGVNGVYLRKLATVLTKTTASWIAAPKDSDMSFKAESLTVRERELLVALSVGKMNKAIARDLNISGNTVAWHLKNLFAKLGVNTRTEAADVARRMGLIG